MNRHERSGKWTAEEESYAAALMEAFHAGLLSGVEEGISLRKILAKKLRCSAKRVSKKYEGTDYNGKMIYLRKVNATEEEIRAKREHMARLEESFLDSVARLKTEEESKRALDQQGSMEAGQIRSAAGTGIGTSGESMSSMARVPQNHHQRARMLPEPTLPIGLSSPAALLSLRGDADLGSHAYLHALQGARGLAAAGVGSNMFGAPSNFSISPSTLHQANVQEMLSRSQGLTFSSLHAERDQLPALSSLGRPSLDHARMQLLEASMRAQANSFAARGATDPHTGLNVPNTCLSITSLGGASNQQLGGNNNALMRSLQQQQQLQQQQNWPIMSPEERLRLQILHNRGLAGGLSDVASAAPAQVPSMAQLPPQRRPKRSPGAEDCSSERPETKRGRFC
ncbi:expressed unknown protein [Seminavis robusta]|uniref:Uncharacterized protein n=1 Tax=Seminavis robusta TaxID=568900 RepID=A0A9N8EF44_9STRA|nr:expressed unknown protein [Seminavis robusta]|eukprot:Sro986_g228100.1 n/a (397) ;mRNA; r:18159-19444